TQVSNARQIAVRVNEGSGGAELKAEGGNDPKLFGGNDSIDECKAPTIGGDKVVGVVPNERNDVEEVTSTVNMGAVDVDDYPPPSGTVSLEKKVEEPHFNILKGRYSRKKCK
ncbi:MAG: hypothetical protein MJE68_28920, partial [Proteobacteria bacterium]|nr:hypothetical protein [Pseudomonadota bacterium]